MALLALMVGVAVLAAGVVRLGFLADLLSRPVMSGFLSGVGITVVIGQLHVLLGLPAASGGSLEKLVDVVGNLGGVHGATLAIGAAVLVVLVLGERLGRRFPGALVAVVGSLGAVAVFDLPGPRRGDPRLRSRRVSRGWRSRRSGSRTSGPWFPSWSRSSS